jgi:hypothetical protein
MALEVNYGTPNMDLIGRWLRLADEEDGPFWAVNLMKYRAKAVYADGSDHGRSGKEADDAYSPLGPLREIGAVVALHGDVIAQPLGAPAWDRVGIVRYPSRRAFLEMQRRDDFQRQHEHKSAGMERTIVLACLPAAGAAPTLPDGPTLAMQVVPEGAAATANSAALDFEVEGVIVGDDRRWSSVRFSAGGPDDVAPAPEGSITVVVERTIDRLVESVREA